MTLPFEDIMSSNTNTSALDDVQGTRRMDLDKSMAEGENLTVNSLP